MMRAAAALIFALLFAGCVSSQLSVASVSGEYEMGGFNEITTLSLHLDGTYRISQWMMACVIDEHGNITVWQDEESGSWKVEDGVVTLHTSASKPRDYYGWFSRLRFSRRNGMRALVSHVPSSPIYGRWGFIEKPPNKAPEPTTCAHLER